MPVNTHDRIIMESKGVSPGIFPQRLHYNNVMQTRLTKYFVLKSLDMSTQIIDFNVITS